MAVDQGIKDSFQYRIEGNKLIFSNNKNTYVFERILLVSLEQQFTLKKGQVAKIVATGLEVEIKAFFNSPCPKGAQCFWSGVGIEFEYRLNGQKQKGINLVQVFGYQTTIVKTDYETYADIVVGTIK